MAQGFRSLFHFSGGVSAVGAGVGQAAVVFAAAGVSYKQPVATVGRRFVQDIERSNVQSANRRNLPE